MYEMFWQGETLCVRGVCFDAQLTLVDSAQVFHWRVENGVYTAKVGARPVCLRPLSDGFDLMQVQHGDERFWARYFDLERDQDALKSACAAYLLARQAIEMLPGLRVLNQPPWETLLTFIISANNNVGRIRRLVRTLIEQVGEGDFPSPQCLAQTPEQTLRALGFGYRAAYLVRTAQLVADGFPLETLAQLGYEQAHRQLVTLPGVGDKVADCVQLFSMMHESAFPVDVWMERVMREWFGVTQSRRKMREAALHMFGESAGLVQQYLFHCARMGRLEQSLPERK